MFKNNTSYFISLAVAVLFMIWTLACIGSFDFVYKNWWGFPLVFTFEVVVTPMIIIGVDALLNKLVFKE